MNDNNINEEWPDKQQGQPGMPSPDEAWSNMLAKLEEEMPAGSAVMNSNRQKIWRNTIAILAILLLLLSIIYTTENSNTQQTSSATKASAPATSAGSQHQRTSTINTTPSVTNKEKSTANSNIINNSVSLIQKRNSNNHVIKELLSAIQRENTSYITDTSVSQNTTTALNNEVAVSNNQKTSIEPSKPANAQPGDTAKHSENENKEKLTVQAGLQWTAQIPVAGTKNYFTGPSATIQPWRVLLPGAWVSVKTEKDIFMAEVNPFAAASFNPTSFYTNTSNTEQTTLDTNKLLSKVFGISGAIAYQHNLKNNWWIGGGLQTNFWKKGVAVLTVKEHDNITNVTTTSSKSFAINQADWQYFSKFQLYPHVQVMYCTNKYQAGLRAGATFTALAKDNGPKNLVLTELFFRLPLISNNKK